jgi:hypothetical protein
MKNMNDEMRRERGIYICRVWDGRANGGGEHQVLGRCWSNNFTPAKHPSLRTPEEINNKHPTPQDRRTPAHAEHPLFQVSQFRLPMITVLP